MAVVKSASWCVRKIGAVPVFGFTRAKSFAVRGKHLSGSASSEISCKKNAHFAGAFRGVGLAIKAQNLKRLSTSGKKGSAPKRVRRFSKSYSAFRRPPVETPLKNSAAVLSDAMPDGVRRPTKLFGLTSVIARSTNNE